MDLEPEWVLKLEDDPRRACRPAAKQLERVQIEIGGSLVLLFPRLQLFLDFRPFQGGSGESTSRASFRTRAVG